ncbi:MAG: histidine kinase dimerization/phosphoacceptor domain -containing protein [Chloroflexota bacterium]
MISQILQFIAPPVFDDEDKSRTAGLLNAILLIVLVAVAIVMGMEAVFLANPVPLWTIELGLALLTIGSKFLMQRGHVRPACILLISTLWGGVTAANLVLGGLNGAASLNYITVIIMAGLLLGGRAALGLAGLTVLSGALMLYSHQSGTFPFPVTPPTPTISWLKLSINSLAAAVLLDLAIQAINTAIAQARSNAADLSESNHQLKAAHVALEIQATELSLVNAALEQEIVERKRTEAALAEERNLLRTLIDNLPDAIYVKDTASRFLIGNNAVSQIMGAASPDELIGKTDFDFYPPELAQQYYRGEQKVIRTGRPLLDKEEPILTSTGNRRWFSTTKVPLQDRAGNIRGVVGMGRDITERKLANDRLKASVHEKEVLVQEIHHRVKNNLQIISSLLNLQSGYLQDRGVQEILQESQQRIHSMALIHEKLYQSGNLANINFSAYVYELVTFLFKAQKRPEQQLSLKFQIEEVFLKIDTAVPCGLILNELVTNALKHAFPNGQSGEIRVELRAVNAGQYQLVVADNGLGFPAGINRGTASGLGLQLVNTLVKQLEGDIDFESGQGTSCKISFAIP